MQTYNGPASPACLDELHAALERLWAEAPDVDARLRMRFATALGELVANVVVHGRTPHGAIPTLTVRMWALPERLDAELIDDGAALSQSALAGVPSDELDESGRGLALAREVVDELVYTSEQDGNRWTLTVGRPR